MSNSSLICCDMPARSLLDQGLINRQNLAKRRTRDQI